MKNEFVSYELAVKLKAIGFDEPCMFVHDTWGNTKNWTEDGEGEHRNSHINASIYYSAPLFQQVFRWFREKYGLHSFIDCKWKNLGWEYELVDLNKMESISTIGNYGYNTPKDAELTCLEKLIEIVENEKTL